MRLIEQAVTLGAKGLGQLNVKIGIPPKGVDAQKRPKSYQSRHKNEPAENPYIITMA